jgi:two-component system, sensor histidine kinase and response regulator
MLYVFLFQIEHLFAAPNDQIRVTLRSDRTGKLPVLNLISNAIKYGGRPARVELSAQRDADKIRYTIHDNGAGLSVLQQSQLFTPFVRLQPERTEGTGLGLSIVKRMVEKMGGEIGVDSAIGKGTSFYFVLPAATLPTIK